MDREVRARDIGTVQVRGGRRMNEMRATGFGGLACGGPSATRVEASPPALERQIDVGIVDHAGTHLLDLAGGTSLGDDGEGRAGAELGDGRPRGHHRGPRRHRAAGRERLGGAGGGNRGGGECAHYIL